MALKSTRGRFPKVNGQKKNMNPNNLKSALRDKGRFPLFGEYDVPADSISKKDIHIEKTISSKTKEKQKTNFFESYEVDDDSLDVLKEPKKKLNKVLIISMILLELLTLVVIYVIGTGIRFSKMTQEVKFNKQEVKNTNIDKAKLDVMKGYKTVVVFGVDSRDGSVGKGNNADVNMIVRYDYETGEIKIVPVLRDLYLNINNGYNKLNSAYLHGGPELAVKTLNKNLDLDIDSYFSFNWKAVADAITLLGGIDLEITKAEYKYMNAFIHETCKATGIDAKNPAAHYISGSGFQHLNGVQAVAYGRLRLMDSDFKRAERQALVVKLAWEKAKQQDLEALTIIMKVVLPQTAYDYDISELTQLLKTASNINIKEVYSCPEVNDMVMMKMGVAGDSVVPNTLTKIVKKLHKVLYDDEDYDPSSAVKAYSNRITELKKQYQEEKKESEAAEIESIKESIEAENNNNQTKSSTKKETNSNNEEEVVPILETSTKKSTETKKSNTTKETTIANEEITETETTTINNNFNDSAVAVVLPGSNAPISETTAKNSGPIDIAPISIIETTTIPTPVRGPGSSNMPNISTGGPGFIGNSGINTTNSANGIVVGEGPIS